MLGKDSICWSHFSSYSCSKGLAVVKAIELEGVIIKDYFYTLYDKSFVKSWL